MGSMKKKWIDIISFLLMAGIVICVNIIISKYFFRADFTEDKRYSLAPVTKDMLKEMSGKIYVEIFLDGALDPEYELLKKSIKEKLEEFDIYASGGVEYRFTDPAKIEDPKARNNFYNQLASKGLVPRYFLKEDGGKREEVIIVPGAFIYYGDREVPVLFMKDKKGVAPEEVVNQAVEGVEYELIAALRKVSNREPKNIAFVEGHGEAAAEEIKDVTSSLFEFYNVDRIKLSEKADLDTYEALIVASPESAFSEKDKYFLDQYLMRGGNVMFLLDQLNVYEDSLVNGVTYALPYELNLDDMLFKYGVRLNNTLIQDKMADVISVNSGVNDQLVTVKYPFYPLVYNFGTHPIVKNLNLVRSRFASTIDTVKADGVTKTPLLFTSDQSKVLNAPIQINLNDLRKDEETDFASKKLPIGWLLEGKFTSLYRYRPVPVEIAGRRDSSGTGRIIVVSDGDILNNGINSYYFSNNEFMINAVDYLTGEPIVDVRAKDVKIRPLDKARVHEGRVTWQVLNILVPVLLIIAFGVARYILRKKKFESFKS